MMPSLVQIGSVYRKDCHALDDSVSGLHNEIFRIIATLPGHDVVDVGAGRGAMSLRLHDAGYYVAAIDIRDDWQHNVAYMQADLNSSDWGIPQEYDIAVSIETIEHLENPRAFLRGIKKIIKPGGHIVLSMPNIENPISKFWFLLRGQFALFRKEDLSYGHINPMTEFEVGAICEDLGLQIEGVYRGGNYPIIYIHRNLKDSLLWSIVNLISLPFSRNLSVCKIYVISV